MVYTYDTNIQFADFQKKKYKEFLNLITLIEKNKISLFLYPDNCELGKRWNDSFPLNWCYLRAKMINHILFNQIEEVTV